MIEFLEEAFAKLLCASGEIVIRPFQWQVNQPKTRAGKPAKNTGW